MAPMYWTFLVLSFCMGICYISNKMYFLKSPLHPMMKKDVSSSPMFMW